jgi:hypothetical protein
MKAVREGEFHPDREKDELTCVLRNLEHPRRTRGTSGSVPWKHGFSTAVPLIEAEGERRKRK